ncbi:MAG TPA: sulfite exporter TauE/SafE family protein [Bacillota bacterium]|nr:sulfite exporter TauE/SafE family protein [Bacillota bacterium]
MLEYDLLSLVLLAGAAILIGFSKTGILGASLPAVAMITYTFDAKVGSGFMLTLLVVADIPAVLRYGRFGKLKDMLRLLPPALLGIILGALVGDRLNEAQFKLLMGAIVSGCLLLILYGQIFKKEIKAPDNKLFHIVVGIVSGFSSMVGNAAGPIFSLYLLSMSFDRNKFIGTAAWFFFTVNLIKLPFHIFMWGTITGASFKYTLAMIPFILLGAIAGIYLVKRIKEKHFQIAVSLMTAIAAVYLMI